VRKGRCVQNWEHASRHLRWQSLQTQVRGYGQSICQSQPILELTSQVESRLTFVNNVEAFYLSGLDPGEPRVQVGRATPPALRSKLLKFLISTLINRLNTHEIRVARCEFEVKSLDSAKCTQVVAAETPTPNSIKDALFPPKRKAGLSSSHSQATRVFFAG
jgi:hypothetical protein